VFWPCIASKPSEAAGLNTLSPPNTLLHKEIGLGLSEVSDSDLQVPFFLAAADCGRFSPIFPSSSRSHLLLASSLARSLLPRLEKESRRTLGAYSSAFGVIDLELM
jgi:hypothetical protein